MRLVVGVDGGGTGSLAVVLGEDGRERVRVAGPASLVDPTRPELAVRSVRELVERAATAAGAELPFAGLVAGLAGAGREPARQAVEQGLCATGLSLHTRVQSDADVAFYDAFERGPGVLLIAGTGSVVIGVAPDGRRIRVGGWGERLGDAGSAFDVGLRALRAIARAHDRVGPETALTSALLAHLGKVGAPELVPWVADAAKSAVAGLARQVVAVAAGGDAVAAEVLRGAAQDLRDQLAACHRRLGPWPTPPRIALVGGMVTGEGPLRASLELTAHDLGAELCPSVDPARGAARLALEL